MRQILRRFLGIPAAEAPSGPVEATKCPTGDHALAAASELHKRVLRLEASEAEREAQHMARLDSLNRLYKRITQRIVQDGKDAAAAVDPPTPKAAEPSPLDFRRKLGR